MQYLRFMLVVLALFAPLSANGTKPSQWLIGSAELLVSDDDDIRRNIGITDYFDGIEISERRFVENGFAWHLIRFASKAKPEGPLWMVPHDDENAGFDAMISAVKMHGGVGITINSGTGSVRRQSGKGNCGIKAAIVTSCDPNRNFSDSTPVFTSAFLSERSYGWPIIALHTNMPGFSGDDHDGRGEITILNIAAFKLGLTKARLGGHFASNPKAEMANYDTLGLTAYLARNGEPSVAAVACRNAIVQSGVHFWHERVDVSDGSMSNYLALYRPDITYFNAESRDEANLAVAAARHKIMIDAYLSGCINSGDKPAP